MWGMEKKRKKKKTCGEWKKNEKTKKKIRKATILSPRILEYKLIGASFSTNCYF
jgi:hypothetical protein